MITSPHLGQVSNDDAQSSRFVLSSDAASNDGDDDEDDDDDDDDDAESSDYNGNEDSLKCEYIGGKYYDDTATTRCEELGLHAGDTEYEGIDGEKEVGAVGRKSFGYKPVA